VTHANANFRLPLQIGFITRFFLGGEVNITMNQGSHCWAPNENQRAAGAWGLKDCVGDGFAQEIKACQARGKKVLISAGGTYANLSIPSDADAEILAERLWNLFLGGTDTDMAPTRPYGDAVLDGFDFGELFFLAHCDRSNRFPLSGHIPADIPSSYLSLL